MDNNATNIKVYGASRCHKTQYYPDYFKKKHLEIEFLNVEKNKKFAIELRNLYESGKLNFPTILIQEKKLRTPSLLELEKWLKRKELIKD